MGQFSNFNFFQFNAHLTTWSQHIFNQPRFWQAEAPSYPSQVIVMTVQDTMEDLWALGTL